MKERKQSRSFVVIALGWSYICWVGAIIFSIYNPDSAFIQVLHFLGGVGPLVATIVIISRMGNWREYLKRVVNFSGFSPFVVLVLFSPIVIALIVNLVMHGKFTLRVDFINNGLLYVVFLFFFGPLPEELGWRGVLFDSLHKQSFLRAQVITAFVWFIWHLPLFFIVGTYQFAMGFATTSFFLWALQILLQSMMMGYLYIISNRSIASAVLFHYFVNLAGEAFDKNSTTEIITIGFLAGLTILLALVHQEIQYNKIK